MSRPATPKVGEAMELRVLDPEAAAARDGLAAFDWDPELRADAFVARERVLARTAFGRSRVAWGLTADGAVLSSCETYERRWPCGRVWLVASVWTAPDLRGRGHATRMLAALAERVAAAPDAAALVLFSDVGAAIYERVGFRPYPALDAAWPAAAGDPDDGPWQRLGEADVAALRARDPDQLAWQLDRARTRAELLPTRRPSRVGARLPSGDWMVWAEEGSTLQVLALEVSSPDAGRALATAAARTAAAAGLAEVVAWDPGPWAPGARRIRTARIPMARPLSVPFADLPVPGRDAWV
jgi:GNAT superfamily N-acetyltransferase